METLKIKNLDQLYSTIKSEVGTLSVTGWDAEFEGVFFKNSDTLLQWFFNNIATLKSGVENLLVACASGSGNYSINCDSLTISTQVTKMGLLVELKKSSNEDNGYHDYSGRYANECIVYAQVFLLKIQ